MSAFEPELLVAALESGNDALYVGLFCSVSTEVIAQLAALPVSDSIKATACKFLSLPEHQYTITQCLVSIVDDAAFTTIANHYVFQNGLLCALESDVARRVCAAVVHAQHVLDDCPPRTVFADVELLQDHTCACSLPTCTKLFQTLFATFDVVDLGVFVQHASKLSHEAALRVKSLYMDLYNDLEEFLQNSLETVIPFTDFAALCVRLEALDAVNCALEMILAAFVNGATLMAVITQGMAMIRSASHALTDEQFDVLHDAYLVRLGTAALPARTSLLVIDAYDEVLSAIAARGMQHSESNAHALRALWRILRMAPAHIVTNVLPIVLQYNHPCCSAVWPSYVRETPLDTLQLDAVASILNASTADGLLKILKLVFERLEPARIAYLVQTCEAAFRAPNNACILTLAGLGSDADLVVDPFVAPFDWRNVFGNLSDPRAVRTVIAHLNDGDMWQTFQDMRDAQLTRALGSRVLCACAPDAAMQRQCLATFAAQNMLTRAFENAIRMQTALVMHEEPCTICWEGMAVDTYADNLTCGHVFHMTCLQTWFITQRQCPMCRRPHVGALLNAVSTARARIRSNIVLTCAFEPDDIWS